MDKSKNISLDSLNPSEQLDFQQSFQTAAANSIFFDQTANVNMEFTKNYSDDLLMGQSEDAQKDLVEPESGFINLSERFHMVTPPGDVGIDEEKQLQPAMSKPSPSAAQSSTSCGVSPNLKAVKKLLLANYSKISHVLHWKNPIETGIIFAIGATIILALTFFSIISVFAYTGLGLITGSSSIRAYKAVMKMLNMPQETKFDYVWNKVLDINVSISQQKMHDLIDSSLGSLNATLSFIKRVLLVEDKFATIAFGSFLYVLTYLGSWFNGMTLITLTFIALFTLPLVYDKNRAKIDGYANLASNQVSSAVSIVTKKFSSVSSGSEASKKKD